MKEIFPVPSTEKERLKALKSYDLLDTLPEDSFDRLTKLASIICDVPISLVSLIDENRQWFKSKIGLEINETPRGISFCQHAILNETIFEIQDAKTDVRFKENPLVTGNPNIRFYAGFPLIDPNGYALGTLCVIDDKPKKLSDQQQHALKLLAEETVSQILLREANSEREKFERFFKLTVEFVCIAGMDGFFKNINQTFERVLGWTEDELYSKPLFDIFHKEDAEKIQFEMEKLAKGEKTIDFTVRLVAKNKEIRWVKWSANADLNTNNIFAVGRDITKQRLMEEKLLLSEKQYRAFFENSQGLMCTHDLKGNFLSINNAGAELLGYEPEEYISKNLKEIFSQDTKDLVEEYLKTIKKEGKAKGLMKVLHKDGSEKIWMYNNLLVGTTEENKYVVANAIDLTERIQMEQNLKVAKEIAEKNMKAKDIFLSNMSHEIRTPMNAIIGFSDVLKSTTLNSEQREFVEGISIAGDNLLVIINDILDFSKIETGNIKLESRQMDLSEIIHNVKTLLQGKAKEKRINLNFYVESGIPKRVMGDPVRLNQILINLVGNAIKFTPTGKVEVFCNLIHEEPGRCQVEFRIKDTGIGIPLDKQESVFERFKQADDDTTRLFGGTGLGLSITKKLVQLYQGSIELSSDVGKGAEFIVKISFLVPDKSEIVTYDFKKHKSVNFPMNILLVEDNEQNQLLAQRILENQGSKVTIAENGQIAIDYLNQSSYDLILMDLQMPVMDGYVASVFIRTVLKLKTPIIAMTAHSLVGEKEKCMEKGMNEYLSKPYKSAELIEVINSLFSDTTNSSRESEPTHSTKEKKSKASYNLDELIEIAEGDQNFILKSVKIFLNNVPRDLDAMHLKLNQNEFEEIARLAHKLKSSYGLLGADSAFKLCNEIEFEKDSKKIKKKIENLMKESNKTIEALKKQFPEMESN